MAKSYYYNVADDVQRYPEAWCVVAIGGRGTGKTYSALMDCYKNKRKFCFVKRTNDDVRLLCAGSGKMGRKFDDSVLDISPFKPINRDIGSDVHPFTIDNGLAGFWECSMDAEGNHTPEGKPIGYIISLNAVSKYSGFDMSEVDWMIFDEFVPRAWERVLRTEGDQMLDLYKTIARDREHRGRGPLKLVLLANAVNISSPAANILEVSDMIADMTLSGMEEVYLAERGILIHLIQTSTEFHNKETQTILYKAMGATSWGKMAFENDFAYNDFTSVGKVQMKNFRPVCSYIYKEQRVYIYQREGKFFFTFSKANNIPPDRIYNLKLENEQKRFYYDYVLDLWNECISGNVKFEKYSMYDLLVNYHKIFKLR